MSRPDDHRDLPWLEEDDSAPRTPRTSEFLVIVSLVGGACLVVALMLIGLVAATRWAFS